MSAARGKTDWAEDEEEDPLALPEPKITKNANGTETHISYKWREDGKKVKVTRIIKKTVNKTKVNPRVAERRAWAKFGDSAKDPAGPQNDTTTVGENIELHPRQNYRGTEKEEGGPQGDLEKQKAALKNATVKCRICNGEHFTARCPFKGTMAPEGEPAGEPAADPMAETGAAGSGKGGSSYVPPALRGKAGGAASVGEKMGGKYDRDDLATLRVTNVSEFAEEQVLREMFERYGRVTRVFLAKDRETGRAKGFAFVSFADRTDAAKACAKMDGVGYESLILRVEFAKKAT